MFRAIQLFVAAYEERSFTSAAEREGATQSGVSQHIRKIEERFGASLFERKNGRIIATPAADRYYRHCIQQLRLHEQATVELRSFASEITGDLTVGLMPTMNARVLAPALLEFHSLIPNAKVNIVEAFSGILTEDVRRGGLDFAIVPRFGAVDGLRLRPFASTPEVLLAGPTSDLPRSGSVRLKDIAALKLVLPNPENTRSESIRDYLDMNSIDVVRTIELDTMLGTIDLVAKSDWKAILPALLVEGLGGERNLSVLKLVEPGLTLELVIVEPARHTVPAVAEAFLKILKAQTDLVNKQWGP